MKSIKFPSPPMFQKEEISADKAHMAHEMFVYEPGLMSNSLLPACPKENYKRIPLANCATCQFFLGLAAPNADRPMDRSNVGPICNHPVLRKAYDVAKMLTKDLKR